MSPRSNSASLVKVRGLIALAVGLLLAVLAYKAVSRLAEKPKTSLLSAVVAAVEVAPGEPLVSSKLQILTRPANEVPPGAFDRTDRVTGRIAARRIGQGEFVTGDHLLQETPFSAQSISRWLGPGQRAIALKVDEVSGLSGELVPGDLVDVIATSRLSNAASTQISRIVLEEVKVLSVSMKKKGALFPGGSKKKTGRVTSVTLALNPDEANILAACEGASLRLAARSRDGNRGSGEEFVYSPLTGPKSVSELEQLWEDKDLDFNRRISSGMRAVTIALSREDGICGLLFPGNKVDVIAVTLTGSISTEGREEGSKAERLETSRLAKTILQNVGLMAVEDELEGVPGEWRSREENWLATLLLSPEQAEKLISVSYDDSYKLKIVRRNPEDREITATEGERILELFFKPEEMKYEVEIYRRGEVDIRNFEAVDAQ